MANTLTNVARDFDGSGRPAEILVYTAEQWEPIKGRGRFGKTLEQENGLWSISSGR